MRDLVLRTRGQIGVLVGPASIDVTTLTADVTRERLEVVGMQRAGLGGQTRTTIAIRNGRRVRVRHCELTMDGSLTDESVVFARGEDLTIESNRMETFPLGTSFGAWGGLQLGGYSRRIEVRLR